jgi:UDP-N-acetylmuramate dehydrogenase
MSVPKRNTPDWRDELSGIPELRVKWDEPLARYTSFKIGGPADAVVWADTREQLCQVAEVLRVYRVPLLTLGRGTNLLVNDRGFRGVVLKLGKEFEAIHFDGVRVRAGAAVPMSVLSKECAKQGLSGVEFIFGIPGSVGGGLRMNAGAHGSCFADVVVSAEALDWDYQFVTLDHAGLRFGYRHSILGEYVCTTEATFELTEETPTAVEERTKTYYFQRMASQPLSLPSAGCVFRNPDVGAAGKLIDECGLKGLSVGGARVSEKHANYIVGSEGATAEDVLRLIAEVRRRVKEQTGAELELEVKVIEEEGW